MTDNDFDVGEWSCRVSETGNQYNKLVCKSTATGSSIELDAYAGENSIRAAAKTVDVTPVDNDYLRINMA